MNKKEAVTRLKEITRSISDYPKPGIIFRDLTTVFQNGDAFSLALEMLQSCLIDEKKQPVAFNKFVGIEARGFILAGALAAKMGGGVALLRKPGKLPYKKMGIKYKLEYGEDTLEMHVDAVQPGELVVVVDDLLATGGTAEAGCKLVEEAGGQIVKVLFLVELPELGGRKKLGTYDVASVISFEGH
ncbi:MAG: adenine phosphoribosyltransferase [Bacteroidales bacterium]|nr:adenine phosphoribosyltransferase [Bacteroidales bacterium]